MSPNTLMGISSLISIIAICAIAYLCLKKEPFVWPLNAEEKIQVFYNESKEWNEDLMQYKLFWQTRKNAIIFFFGKIACKIFGHQESFDRILLENNSRPVLSKQIMKVCPRCFKVIKEIK